jgi:CDP-2,3-bis-(O-geranylgeranyl)-sn-glycerol synthase
VLDDLFFAIWFFLPAGIANATPVIANRIPVLKQWKTPMDFGRSYRGKRIFGANKTWRGLVFSSFIAGIVGLITYLVYDNYFTNLGLFPSQPATAAFLIGSLLGFGALLGDAIESFFKRQLGKNPGQLWFPFDQIDFIIGALIIISPVVLLSIQQIIMVFVVWFVSHLMWAYIGYRLKLKDSPI